MNHIMASLTSTNYKHFQVQCMTFVEGEGWGERDGLECSEESLTDITKISLASQINI